MLARVMGVWSATKIAMRHVTKNTFHGANAIACKMRVYENRKKPKQILPVFMLKMQGNVQKKESDPGRGDYILQEFSPSFIIMCIMGVAIGLPIIIFCISSIRRLHYLKKTNLKIEGELYVSNSGEIFSEFGISVDEIVNRDYILLKVIPIKTTKEEKNNGNISTETHKT